jgi:hypothetical protein
MEVCEVANNRWRSKAGCEGLKLGLLQNWGLRGVDVGLEVDPVRADIGNGGMHDDESPISHYNDQRPVYTLPD